MNTDLLMKLQTVLGPSKTSSKQERLFSCPFCYHHKPKLSINFGNRFGFWKCWVCGKSGKKLISLLYKIGLTSSQISDILEDSFDFIPNELVDEQPQTLALPGQYRPMWEVNTKSYQYRNALAFLRKRGLSLYDIYRYQIGYCETGYYGKRIIIPSYDKDCKLNYFVSRSYYDDYLKYLNPNVSKNTVVFENLINWNLPIVLTEGVYDAISVKRNSIPLLGKILYDKVKAAIIKEKPPVVYVMLDGDAYKQAIYIENILKNENINTKLVKTSELDASDLGFESSWDLIKSSKSSTFVEYVGSKTG